MSWTIYCFKILFGDENITVHTFFYNRHILMALGSSLCQKIIFRTSKKVTAWDKLIEHGHTLGFSSGQNTDACSI